MSIHLVYPEEYQRLLNVKRQLTEQEFAEFQPPALEVFESPVSHYRMRAEFKIWHSGDQVDYAMFRPGQSKKPFIVQDFPVASEYINRLMPLLRSRINETEELKSRLFQMDFLTSTLDDAVVTFIYHRPLNDEWKQAAEALQKDLQINIIGRSRKQKIVLGRDFVSEAFNLGGHRYTYRQVEGAFSQPNAVVCEKMLNWASSVTQGLEGDLLELYCGNGNFTLPLSANFDRVLATEIAKSSVETALQNVADNAIDTVQIVRLSSEEFTQAIDGVRPFRRLQGVDLAEYNFSTIFVDPPRAGLDHDTCGLVQRYDNILYISCNPATLRENLVQLCQTHRIARFALFDQFPYTDHRECGVFLERR